MVARSIFSKEIFILLLPGTTACLLCRQVPDDCCNPGTSAASELRVPPESCSLRRGSGPAKKLYILTAPDLGSKSRLSRDSFELFSLVPLVEQVLKQLGEGQNLWMNNCAS